MVKSVFPFTSYIFTLNIKRKSTLYRDEHSMLYSGYYHCEGETIRLFTNYKKKPERNCFSNLVSSCAKVLKFSKNSAMCLVYISYENPSLLY